MILNLAAMNNGIVSNGYMITNFSRCTFISSMNNSSVLNVYMIPNLNAVDITANDGVKPNAAPITHQHIADKGGVIRHKAILSVFRGLATYRFDEHVLVLRRADDQLELWSQHAVITHVLIPRTKSAS